VVIALKVNGIHMRRACDHLGRKQRVLAFHTVGVVEGEAIPQLVAEGSLGGTKNIMAKVKK
jgi:hypothetical protein